MRALVLISVLAFLTSCKQESTETTQPTEEVQVEQSAADQGTETMEVAPEATTEEVAPPTEEVAPVDGAMDAAPAVQEDCDPNTAGAEGGCKVE